MSADTIGFIGAGNMASAIIKGLILNKLYIPSNIYVSDINQQQLEQLTILCPGIHTSTDNVYIVKHSKTIILATKPHHVHDLLIQISPYIKPSYHLIISICLGLSTKWFDKEFNSINNIKVPVIRIMPNTPSAVGLGASGICQGTYTTQEHIDKSKQIMSAVGLAILINESDIDALTGVSGSGVAFVFAFIEAMAAGGVRAGLAYPVAYQLAAQTVYGAAGMVKDSGVHAAMLREQVCSAGGATIAGVHTLEQGRFKGVVMDSVMAVVAKSQQMTPKL